MKVFTLNEIHHVNKKTGKPEIAEPNRIIDIPQEEALRLISKLAVRRLTAQEIELDKLKAGRAPTDADEGAEGAEGAWGVDGAEGAEEAAAAATTGSRGRGRKPAAAKADNTADTGDTGGY